MHQDLVILKEADKSQFRLSQVVYPDAGVDKDHQG